MLSTAESQLVKGLEAKITAHNSANFKVGKYYVERYRTNSIGVTPDLAALKDTVVGWGSTVVDTLEERVDLLGWSTRDGDTDYDADLEFLFEDSGASEEAHQAHLDAFIYGIGFVTVTKGGEGEPPVLVKAHSATSATADIDWRTGLAKTALTRNSSTSQTLWTSDEVIELTRAGEYGSWSVAERIPHGLGRCPVIPLVNRSRAGDRRGRSEITPAIRSYIASATRALKGMDVNREFFSAPQRHGTGMTPDQFVGADGQPKTGWSLASSQMLVAPLDENGERPEFGEFSTVSPGPFIEQMTGLAGLVATESGMPYDYLGVHMANPSSAEAIGMLESRLVKRAKRRQSMFTRAWSEVARLSMAIFYDMAPVELPRFICHWGDPGTPTTASEVDALVKLIQVGSLPADADVVLERANFTVAQRRQIEAQREKRRSSDRLSALSALINGGGSAAATQAMTEEAPVVT